MNNTIVFQFYSINDKLTKSLDGAKTDDRVEKHIVTLSVDSNGVINPLVETVDQWTVLINEMNDLVNKFKVNPKISDLQARE